MVVPTITQVQCQKTDLCIQLTPIRHPEKQNDIRVTAEILDPGGSVLWSGQLESLSEGGLADFVGPALLAKASGEKSVVEGLVDTQEIEFMSGFSGEHAVHSAAKVVLQLDALGLSVRVEIDGDSQQLAVAKIGIAGDSIDISANNPWQVIVIMADHV
jgi:hypothetical protein